MLSNHSTSKSAFQLSNFRDVDASGDTDPYVGFLDRFSAEFREMIGIGLDLLGLRPGSTVLDVGCGPGATIPELAARVGPEGRVAGIDVSARLVDEARRRVEGKGLPVEVRVGDAQRLEFADATFDAARADRVMAFVPDPRAAMRELVRVVRPGGRVVITEPDLGATMLDSPDVATTREVLRGASEQFVNGWIGRQLRGLFLEAGLISVEMRCFSTPTLSYSEWSRKFGIEEVLRAAVASGRVATSCAERWLQDLRERDASGRFLACGTLCMVAATR